MPMILYWSGMKGGGAELTEVAPAQGCQKRKVDLAAPLGPSESV